MARIHDAAAGFPRWNSGAYRLDLHHLLHRPLASVLALGLLQGPTVVFNRYFNELGSNSHHGPHRVASMWAYCPNVLDRCFENRIMARPERLSDHPFSELQFGFVKGAFEVRFRSSLMPCCRVQVEEPRGTTSSQWQTANMGVDLNAEYPANRIR